MYIIIQKEPLRVTTFETKSDLANYIGVHRNTITNKFDKLDYWECSKGTVYISDKHYKTLRKGNTDDRETKTKKANGEIPCKKDK